MHRTLVLASSLLLSVSTGWAGVTPAAEQTFLDAVRQTDIFAAEDAPFLLELQFSAQIQVPTDGRLIIRWASKDRYWRRVELGGFQQTEIRKGELVYTSRNISFTPQRVTELLGLVHGRGNPNTMQIKKERKRVERGVEATCFDVHLDSEQGAPTHEMCINPASHEFLSDDWRESQNEHRRIEFSSYAEFRGRRSPRRIILWENGSSVIDAQITRLETVSLDEALLVPPLGAIERRMCDGIKHPIPVKTPDPIYPKSSRENRMTGDSLVSMTVLPDGSVDNIHLIGSSTRTMDDATLRAIDESTLQVLKGWKFKPAMCGMEPVASDIQVRVSFERR